LYQQLLSVGLDIIKQFSNRYCYSFRLILTKLAARVLRASVQQNCGTDFRNFDFEIFGNFFKNLTFRAA